MQQYLKTEESVALGAGAILVGDATTYISQFDPILTTANYFGYMSEISIKAEKTVRKVKKAVSKVTSDISTNTEGLSVSCSYMEITPKAILYALGGDGNTGITGDMLGTFGISQENTWLRLEIYFEYTGKDYQKIYVIPKAKVISPFSDLLVQTDKGIENKIDFEAASALDVAPKNAVWKNHPLGRVIFQVL